jgi:hypothetical protein
MLAGQIQLRLTGCNTLPNGVLSLSYLPAA